MPRRNRKTGRISVFKGRKAKLNRAIFYILAGKGSLTIYDIHKMMKSQRGLRHIHYPSVNKRVRSLEETGYIRRIGYKKTKVGFRASIYELTTRAYLAILLDSINLDGLLRRVDEANASAILVSIVSAA